MAVANTQMLTMQTTVTDVTSRSAFSFNSSAQPTMFPSPQHSTTGREYGALHEVRKLMVQTPAPSTLTLISVPYYLEGCTIEPTCRDSTETQYMITRVKIRCTM